MSSPWQNLTLFFFSFSFFKQKYLDVNVFCDWYLTESSHSCTSSPYGAPCLESFWNKPCYNPAGILNLHKVQFLVWGPPAFTPEAAQNRHSISCVCVSTPALYGEHPAALQRWARGAWMSGGGRFSLLLVSLRSARSVEHELKVMLQSVQPCQLILIVSLKRTISP